MKRLNSNKGFTLLEVIIVLAVFAILAAALFPRLSRILEDSKISRAQTEVDNVGSAINNFNSHTTLWPAGGGTNIGGSPYNQFRMLISGTSSVDGPALNLLTDPSFPGMPPSGGNEDWGESSYTAADVDLFDNHLRLNNPGNGCGGQVGGCNTRYYPPEVASGDSLAFTTAVNQTRDPWKGPYLEVLRFDPWARRYISNIEASWSTDTQNKLISLAISAGPDNVIQTDGNVSDTEFKRFKIRNDDVAYVIRKRAGSL